MTGSSGQKEEPEAKRIRRLNISSGLESSSSRDYERVRYSPVLVKPPDEKNVITVSTSASDMDVSDPLPPHPWRMMGNPSGQFVDDAALATTADDQVRGLPDEVFTGMEELGA